MSYAADQPYPLQGTAATPLIGPNGLLGNMLRGLRWLISLSVFVLIVDLLCVALVWEDGSQTLARLVSTEKDNLGLSPGSAAGNMVDAFMAAAHEWIFVRTGFQDWATSQRSGLLQIFASELQFLLDGAAQGLQLFALRCAVLVLSLPLLLIVAATAVADGLSGWLRRRRAGARESGFIYHRAKRAFPATFVLMWLVCLVPPIAMEPRWALPPFFALFAIALRLRVAYFKKHI